MRAVRRFLIIRARYLTNSFVEGMIKNIVFDVGNVLVTYDWQSYLDSFHFPEEEKEAFVRRMFQHPVWNERDRGSLPDEEYLNEFLRLLPEYQDDVRRVFENIRDTISMRDYSASWTAYLKDRGYKLYILSNYSERVLGETRDKMPFLDNMDGIVFSCFVHYIKPEHEIYEYLLNKYDLVPQECVFLDDNAENVEGARKAGMHAIHFKSFKQGAAELEKLGVR